MEDLYGDISSKVLKRKALNTANVSPTINVHRENHQFFVGGHHRPSFESYASINRSNLENLDSTLIRYLRSGSPAAVAGDIFKTPAIDAAKYRSMIGHQYHNGSSSNNSGGSSNSGFGSRGSLSVSPLSAIENLETTPPSSSFKSPVKVEEDVLVMDGILVGSVPDARARSSASSDSGGSSSSSGGKGFYKTEICRSWEDSDCCRYGSKCQFAHGKEELRPSRFSSKSKPEAQTCKSFISSGSCAYGAKCRFVHHQVMTPPSPTEPAVTLTTKTVSPIKAEPPSHTSITCTSTEWSPQDDGIEVTLPCSDSAEKALSREDVNAYIQNVLYGPAQRKRLPVFTELCLE